MKRLWRLTAITAVVPRWLWPLWSTSSPPGRRLPSRAIGEAKAFSISITPLNARQHTVPVQAVQTRRRLLEPPAAKSITERSLPSMLELLEEHGVVDNFRRLAGRIPNCPAKARSIPIPICISG